MSEKLKLKDMQKHYHEYDLAISDKGCALRAICNFEENNIAYNIVHNIHDKGTTIEVVYTLEEAVKSYNRRLEQ